MNTLEQNFSLRKQIPNLFTAANLVCGCLAIKMIFEQELFLCSILVLMAALFDFFDGMVARLLKVSSPIGAELDSLADVVSFGVVPAFLAFSFLGDIASNAYLPYLGFLIAVLSAFRLAKFNVDDRQTDQFIGLPTPANAMFWISIPLITWQVESLNSFVNPEFLIELLNTKWVLVGLVIILSFLLIAELPLLALKFKSLNWKGNESRFILLATSAILIAVLYFAAIPFILLLYLIISLIDNRKRTHEIQS